MKLEKGLVQIYTGNGKGKTTAAIGLGIRAYGNGLKVIMIQFLKSGITGELNVLNNLGENFKVYRFEKEKDFTWNLNEEQKEELKKEITEGFTFAKKVVQENMCDMLASAAAIAHTASSCLFCLAFRSLCSLAPTMIFVQDFLA